MNEFTRSSALELAFAAVERRDEATVRAAVERISYKEIDPFRLTELAVSAKEGGFPGISREILSATTRLHPHCAQAFFELGVINMLSDRALEAPEAFRRAIELQPEEARWAARLAHALFTIGAYPEGKLALAQARTLSTPDPGELDRIEDFGDYVREVPLGRAMYILEQVKRRYHYLDAKAVFEKIKAAIDKKDGFSLVRLGDGEGAFAKISAIDEEKYRSLYQWLRREWMTLLFGAAFDPDMTGYTSLVDRLMDVCASADIVALPYRSWIEHEYRISSVRGIPGLMNAVRWFHERPQHADSLFLCDQNIHTELHRQGYLETLISGLQSIGLISSNSALPEAMQQRFGIKEIEFLKIPAEKYSASIRNARDNAGVHFPYAFWEIDKALSRPLEGRIYLIAAGTLAKYYAATIKRHGGIALDVGSLVDAWMKIASRPGYESGITM